MVISNRVYHSFTGQSNALMPCPVSEERIVGRTRVTDAVQEAGGRIVAQLMHSGRVARTSTAAASRRRQRHRGRRHDAYLLGNEARHRNSCSSQWWDVGEVWSAKSATAAGGPAPGKCCMFVHCARAACSTSTAEALASIRSSASCSASESGTSRRTEDRIRPAGSSRGGVAPCVLDSDAAGGLADDQCAFAFEAEQLPACRPSALPPAKEESSPACGIRRAVLGCVRALSFNSTLGLRRESRRICGLLPRRMAGCLRRARAQ